jgi:alanine racemase
MPDNPSIQGATQAIVDLPAFRHNLDAVRAYVGPSVGIMAVVKADGYGHGMLRMAEAALAHGVRHFGVARVHEGLELRAAGFTAPTLVFESPAPEAIPEAIAADLELTLVSAEVLEWIEQAARGTGRVVRVQVKVDTGMGRLGRPAEAAASLVVRAARSPFLRLGGVYSHFATSEDPDARFAELQLRRFFDLLSAVRGEGVTIPLCHMANSGAIMTMPDAHLDMVRPGIMLYGYPPGRGMVERFPVRPVLSLVTRAAFVKSVGPNTSISYGRKYFTGRTTTIVTVPAGYADGYSRLLTGKAEALIGGRRYPVVGTICMDQMMIDAGPEAEIRVGDEVVLIGRSGSDQITAWDLAAATGTIPYETTCLLTRRVTRVYRE